MVLSFHHLLGKIKILRTLELDYMKQMMEKTRKLNIYYSSDVKITNFLVCKLSSIDNINTDLREPIDVCNKVCRFHPLLRALGIQTKESRIGIALNSTNGWNVNCIMKSLELDYKWQLINRIWYASHLRSSNYVIQLTHSMLPLSLLILGCYTCSINRYQYTSIADLLDMSIVRDNGSCRICNIECTSTSMFHHSKLSQYDMKWTKWNRNENRELAMICTNWIEDVDVSATILLESLKNECNEWLKNKSNDSMNYIKDVAEDLYSCDSKTFISNMVNMKTKNIIIPLIDGTGSIVPIMIIFCIRDSLREYKSNYVILSNMKLSFYIWIILSESAIFNLLFWLSYQHILSPLYIIINLGIICIQWYSNVLSMMFTDILTDSGIILTSILNESIQILLMLMVLYSNKFIKGQLIEFTNLNINMNDMLLGCILYSIDGWHLYHLTIGIYLLTIAFNVSNWTQYHMSQVVYQLRVRLHHMFYNILRSRKGMKYALVYVDIGKSSL